MTSEHTLGAIGMAGMAIVTAIFLPLLIGIQVGIALHPFIGIIAGILTMYAVGMTWAHAIDQGGVTRD